MQNIVQEEISGWREKEPHKKESSAKRELHGERALEIFQGFSLSPQLSAG